MIPAFIAGRPQKDAEQDAVHLLKDLGLGERLHHKPSELSGGEQQRVAIARALICRPSVVLADEPTGNLDPELSFDMMNLLRRINRSKNKTVVVITHEKNLVDYYKQRVVMLKDGLIIEDRVGGMFE